MLGCTSTARAHNVSGNCAQARQGRGVSKLRSRLPLLSLLPPTKVGSDICGYKLGSDKIRGLQPKITQLKMLCILLVLF